MPRVMRGLLIGDKCSYTVLNMKKSKTIINISDEMMVKKHHNGVRLVAPSHSTDHSMHSLSSHLHLPFNVIFKRFDSAMIKMNESTAKTCGFDSANAGVGATVEEIFATETADAVLRKDQECMRRAHLLTQEQDLMMKDGSIKRSISFRLPWYEKNKIIGIMLYGIIVGEHPVYESFQQFNKIDFINLNRQQSTQLDPNFSNRELQCIKLLLRGKTSRDIANTLGLSIRTIETYIDNIKFKLAVQTKPELIEKLMDLLY